MWFILFVYQLRVCRAGTALGAPVTPRPTLRTLRISQNHRILAYLHSAASAKEVGDLNGNFSEANTNMVVSSVPATLTPPLTITNLNSIRDDPQGPLPNPYHLHSVIYNEEDRAAGREELSFLKRRCLFPIFSVLAEGIVPKVVKGDGAKRVNPQPCCCCHLDWRDPTHAPTEAIRSLQVQSLAQADVLACWNSPRDAHFPCCRPVCASTDSEDQALHRLLPPSKSMTFLTAALLGIRLWGRAGHRVSHVAAPCLKTVSHSRPRETSGISSAVSTVEWVWWVSSCEHSCKHKAKRCHVNCPYSCVQSKNRV